MELREYLRVLRKRWKIITALLLACILAGVALTLTTQKKYQATAQVFVSIAGATDASQLAQGNSFAEARVQSYTSVATSPDVIDSVIRDLDLTLTDDQLAGEVSATAEPNTVLIDLNVVDTSAQRAADVANAISKRFGQAVESLEQTSTSGTVPVKVSVTHPAKVPKVPASPNRVLNLGLAVLAGLVIGIGAGLLREMLDNTFKAPEELSNAAKLPVVGTVPWDKRTSANPVSFRADPHGSRAEAFRQLRTTLQFIDIDNPPRVIAVTSALPGEGKTHTAINLAAALAEAGWRVCLVEADLRRPTLADKLGLIGDAGLTSVMIGQAELGEVLQNAGQDLAVLTSGPVPPNPSELLASDHFEKILQKISIEADTIIIDTAPLLPVADGAAVATVADAALLTVRAGKTTRDQVRRALETLRSVDANPVGVVLSMAPARKNSPYQYYYGEYQPKPNKRSATNETDTKASDPR